MTYINRVFLGTSENMSEIPDGVVHTCVTSPPYYGLRDYGIDGQIGREDTVAEYVERLVRVFREVRRVLRADGTAWLNLGDTYSTMPVGRFNGGGSHFAGRNMSGIATSGGINKVRASGLKSKNLIGIPWRVALALQADGWYLRSDIIWHKTACSPSSVKDKPTHNHEYLFFLAKSDRYYYDQITEESGANKRTVWTVSPRPYPGAHFAVFPPELISPCIRAGAPAGGLVLDPFMGSGTTAAVAAENGRHYVGYELNPEYHKLITDRLGLFGAA